jgi:hypothetical protein
MLDLHTGNSGISIDGPNGKLALSASPALTELVKKPGSYELEMTTPGRDVYRVISGHISPIEEVVI